MELGMGIHGESGSQKLKLLPLRQATDLAFGQLFRGTRALDIKRDDDVFLLVNNLGLILLPFAMVGQSFALVQVVVRIWSSASSSKMPSKISSIAHCM